MKCFAARNAGLLAILLCLGALAFAGSVITIPVGTVPKFVAVNQTTNVIYASNLNSNNVSVIDGATNSVVATVPVGTAPAGLDVNSTTNVVYVVNSEGNSVSVIDGSTNIVTATITGMSNPYSLAVNSATNQIFVANGDGNDVSVIDGATNSVIATVPVGRDPWGVSVNSTANLIYVANLLDATLSVIDGASDTVINTFTLPPSYPTYIASDPITHHLFVTDTMNNVVDVLDASSGKLLKTITGGKVRFRTPAYVTVFQPGKSVLISDYSLNTVTAVDESTYATTGLPKAGSGPYGVAVNRKTLNIYTAEAFSDTVTAYNH